MPRKQNHQQQEHQHQGSQVYNFIYTPGIFSKQVSSANVVPTCTFDMMRAANKEKNKNATNATIHQNQKQEIEEEKTKKLVVDDNNLETLLEKTIAISESSQKLSVEISISAKKARRVLKSLLDL